MRTTDRQSCKRAKKKMQRNRLFKTANNLFYRLFMHGGHTNHLADFSWNPNEPWLVCSAAEDNLLQIWKVADAIVTRDDADLPLDELDR